MFVKQNPDNYQFESDSFCLEACRVSWDSDVFGVSVGNITKLELCEGANLQHEFDLFNRWVDENEYAVISCRLAHDKLLESSILERNNFRFIEMVLHPTIKNLQDVDIYEHGIVVSGVEESEVSLIGAISERTFSFERYHLDPFIESDLADKRYRKWAENSYNDEIQHLLKATLNGEIVGFFVVEYKDDLVYWHLTAVSPEKQGQGLGYRVWMAMIEYHKLGGYHRILTTISARNAPVLNLYSKLNFRFLPPEMTFHWTRNTAYQKNILNTAQGSREVL